MESQWLSEPNQQASGMSILLGVEQGSSRLTSSEQLELVSLLEQMGHTVICSVGVQPIICQLCEQHFDILLFDLPSQQASSQIFSFITEHSIRSAIILIEQNQSLPTPSAHMTPSYIQLLQTPFTEKNIQNAIGQSITRFAFSHISESMQSQAQLGFSPKVMPPNFDSVTGLPNRTLFHDRLNMTVIQAKRSKTGIALMHLNLDRFRRINDSLGYSVGDRLLKLLGQRIKERLREGDTLSRHNGDEFLIILPNVESQASAARIAEKLIHSFQSPFMLDDQEAYVSARLGITLFDANNDGAEIESHTLMGQADLAMLQLKHKRQTGYVFYCDSMKLAIPSFSIEHDLRKALRNNDCFVQFQPQVSVDDSSLLGVEALIRWRHPERGLIPPDAFIPIAEQSEQIIDVDTWMLHQACGQIKQKFNEDAPPFKLAVNFSTVFVEQPNFVDVLLTTLAKYDFPNHCFELEITESKEFTDMDQAVEKLTRLRKAGIGVAIDDFGVGNAMFNYLKRIPASTLKIDRSFINDIKDVESGDSIVDAIVAMGLSRNLHIVAEGVETDTQRQYLQKANCHTIQGYLTGKAMSLDEIVSQFCKSDSQVIERQKDNKDLKNTA